MIDLSISENDKIKYFSGKVVYKTTFDGFNIKRGESIILNLNRVATMAKVKINGTYAGGVWTYPYIIDITEHIKKDKNKIKIEVVNTWANRMESGLIGPVTLEKIKY